MYKADLLLLVQPPDTKTTLNTQPQHSNDLQKTWKGLFEKWESVLGA